MNWWLPLSKEDIVQGAEKMQSKWSGAWRSFSPFALGDLHCGNKNLETVIQWTKEKHNNRLLHQLLCEEQFRNWQISGEETSKRNPLNSYFYLHPEWMEGPTNQGSRQKWNECCIQCAGISQWNQMIETIKVVQLQDGVDTKRRRNLNRNVNVFTRRTKQNHKKHFLALLTIFGIYIYIFFVLAQCQNFYN